VHETSFERVLAITRDILRVQELEPALESIARAVQDLFDFKYVTIVAADASGADMTRRVMLGWPEELTAARRYEKVPRASVLEILKPAFEVVENGFFIPAEREFDWDRAIYAGDQPLDSPRESPDSWHERDALAFVLPDRNGEMLAYISVDGPLSGKIPSVETLTSMMLFVNLTGLALVNARAHAAEVERRLLLEASQARLRHEATHDPLTRLPNRTSFAERLSEALDLAKQSNDQTYAVLFIDLDEFKSINDSLGHVAGDQVLVAVSERMRNTLQHDDFVARIGGDEFAIVCGREGARELEIFVERIQDALVRPIEIDGRVVYNTASIGIAIMHAGTQTTKDVLRNADTAMYHAKSLGRARHAFFDEHMHLEVARRLTLTNDLRLAIEREQFSVMYQPIVRIDSGLIIGFEALVRWRNPVTGEVLPGEFIPLAEEVGLVVAIGRFVIVEACRRLAHWRRQAPGLDLRMHINLSVQEVLQPDIDSFVARNLRRFGLAAGDVILEVTETAIMRSGAAAMGALERLRETGVRLCIDDFGTGYSSLRYLHQFPVDCLKIDKSFVESADGILGSPPIVRMMIQLAELYDIEVVAEGVETSVQARSLQELECVYGQGFHFYRPMTPDAVTALLADMPATPVPVIAPSVQEMSAVNS
jgi:diguanylate cyclase (GGDEF)-like protein